MITFFAVLIILIAMAIVAWPLVKGVNKSRLSAVEDTEMGELLAEKDTALLAISELESDYNMGNLSEADYKELRKKYDEQAVTLIRDVDELSQARRLETPAELDDEIEAMISTFRAGKAPAGAGMSTGAETFRSCGACGAPVNPGSSFCPACGAALSSRCPKCTSAVDSRARFCPHCGTPLKVS